MLPGPVGAAAHCKTHRKLEIFGNFVASQSAGPFGGRHFLLERHFAGEMISVGKARRCPFKAGPPEAILVIFGRRALIFFFVWKLLDKNEKWHHFCAHAQWWSPWRRKNVEKGHLAPSNLTFLIIAIDRNGFRRLKEEGLIYKSCLRVF